MIYYCYQSKECLVLIERYGELLINDGISTFGFGCHEFQDEVMIGKYNLVSIYSQHIEEYDTFFEPHEIEKKPELIIAQDTFTTETPGISKRIELNGKTVFDIPNELKDWKIYYAETSVEC